MKNIILYTEPGCYIDSSYGQSHVKKNLVEMLKRVAMEYSSDEQPRPRIKEIITHLEHGELVDLKEVTKILQDHVAEDFAWIWIGGDLILEKRN